MSRFIQSLESRTLFTTSAALAADIGQVITAAATTRVDLKTAASVITADTKTITTDLKSSTTSANRATNAHLLNIFRVDEHKTLATLRAHEAALLAAGTSLSHRAAADGDALLLHPTNARIQARVTADIAALSTVPASLLAKLQADTQNITLGTDLMNIVNANPTNAALAAAVQTAENDGNTAVTNFLSAASAFNTNTGTLDAAVSTTSSGSTASSLVGTYNGTATESAGSKHPGRVSSVTIQIATQGADGSLTGSATITNPGSPSSSFTVTGSVTTSGAVSFTFTPANPQDNGGTLMGTVSGKTISGTYNSPSSSGNSFGTFTVTAGGAA